jgi:signal transduction histidine kinase
MAWGIRVEGAAPLAAVLLGMYLLFLTWLVGLVGSRGQQIRRQNEELERIDRTVRALSEANLDFQELATRMQRETEEQERRRITREIHDIVGYTLTNIQMMMEAATDLVRRDSAGLEDLLVKSRDQAQRGLMETRRAMRNLRTGSGVKISGLGRVEEVARIFERATKARVRLNLGNAPESFGPRIDDVVYRMVQESLTNSLRHGNATEITVSFWVVEGALRLSIADNGAGSGEIVPGIGLAGMAERLAHVGGTMKAENTPFGFLVFSEIPLHREEGL